VGLDPEAGPSWSWVSVKPGMRSSSERGNIYWTQMHTPDAEFVGCIDGSRLEDRAARARLRICAVVRRGDSIFNVGKRKVVKKFDLRPGPWQDPSIPFDSSFDDYSLTWGSGRHERDRRMIFRGISLGMGCMSDWDGWKKERNARVDSH